MAHPELQAPMVVPARGAPNGTPEQGRELSTRSESSRAN